MITLTGGDTYWNRETMHEYEVTGTFNDPVPGMTTRHTGYLLTKQYLDGVSYDA